MNQQTVDMLTDMKLSAMAAEFTAQLQDCINRYESSICTEF